MDKELLITHWCNYRTEKELEELSQKMNRVRKRMECTSSKIDIIREIVKKVYNTGFKDGCDFKNLK